MIYLDWDILLQNTRATGFNQMAPPARTITVSLDMNKGFDKINIHTPIRKLLQCIRVLLCLYQQMNTVGYTFAKEEIPF